MHYRRTQNELLVRLDRGEKLIENLNQLTIAEGLRTVWLQGLGGAQSAELGFYDLDSREYEWQSFHELMEITSLEGNLAWVDDQPKWHIHGTLSGRDYQTVGGHVKELIVGGTCELRLVVMSDISLTRRVDSATGLQLLDVE
jgi:uncharacterized protein